MLKDTQYICNEKSILAPDNHRGCTSYGILFFMYILIINLNLNENILCKSIIDFSIFYI